MKLLTPLFKRKMKLKAGAQTFLIQIYWSKEVVLPMKGGSFGFPIIWS